MMELTNTEIVNNVNEADPASAECLAFGRRRRKASQVVIPCPWKKDFLKIETEEDNISYDELKMLAQDRSRWRQ